MDSSRLSALAREIYSRGPVLFRTLQHLRPFICPFEELLPHVPAGGSVLDVGCGGGLWLHLMARLGIISRGVGFDSSAKAVALATDAAGRMSGNGARTGRGESKLGAMKEAELQFIQLDARAPWPRGEFDVVSIIDVIHHVPPEAQRRVIDDAAGRVAPGGVLIYKDMCRRPRWRAGLNRLHDLVMARQWIHYCAIEEVEAWAVEAGLRVERAAFLPRWWYGHELRVFRRGGVSEQGAKG
ncbi:hypothetical protein BH11PLA1_BH11PLA1_01030 [soil metagenome]